MANKRATSGRGRKGGVVKSAKTSSANRAFYIIIAVIAVAGIATLTYAASRPKAGTTVLAYDSTLPKVESQGYVMGSASAPLEVTEFGDYECPQCGLFATLTEPDVRSRLVNTGRIRWRFIDYPLEMHRNTWNASIAAACADEQGKFWEMHDAIFDNQDRWNGEATSKPDKVLEQIAKPLVPNSEQFDQCLETQKTKPRVQAHYKLAVDRQLPGTPTFLIGDQQISRFLTYDELKQIVDSTILAQAKNPVQPLGDTSANAALKKPGT
jgi:protein-disulfide isomerase